MHLENTADDKAFGDHVEVIIVPFARRPRGSSAFEDQRGHFARLSHIAAGRVPLGWRRRPCSPPRWWLAIKLRIDSPAAASYLVSAMLLRARRTPPGFIGPGLPCPAERPPSGPGWIHEIKHDGFRLMVRRDVAVCGCSSATASIGADASP